MGYSIAVAYVAMSENIPATSPALGQNEQPSAYVRPSLAGSYKFDGSSHDIGHSSLRRGMCFSSSDVVRFWVQGQVGHWIR